MDVDMGFSKPMHLGVNLVKQLSAEKQTQFENSLLLLNLKSQNGEYLVNYTQNKCIQLYAVE